MVRRKKGQQWIPPLLLLVQLLVYRCIIPKMTVNMPSIVFFTWRLGVPCRTGVLLVYLINTVILSTSWLEIWRKVLWDDNIQNGGQVHSVPEFWQHEAQDMNRLSAWFGLDQTFCNWFCLWIPPVRPHLSCQENTMLVPQLSALPSPLLILFDSINSFPLRSLFFSPQAKILSKVRCLHADGAEAKARWQGRKFLSSRSNILEVGCQGACKIWSFRDWMKETLR